MEVTNQNHIDINKNMINSYRNLNVRTDLKVNNQQIDINNIRTNIPEENMIPSNSYNIETLCIEENSSDPSFPNQDISNMLLNASKPGSKIYTKLVEKMHSMGYIFECPLCDLKTFLKGEVAMLHLKIIHKMSKHNRRVIKNQCIINQIETIVNSSYDICNNTLSENERGYWQQIVDFLKSGEFRDIETVDLTMEDENESVAVDINTSNHRNGSKNIVEESKKLKFACSLCPKRLFKKHGSVISHIKSKHKFNNIEDLIIPVYDGQKLTKKVKKQQGNKQKHPVNSTVKETQNNDSITNNHNEILINENNNNCTGKLKTASDTNSILIALNRSKTNEIHENEKNKYKVAFGCTNEGRFEVENILKDNDNIVLEVIENSVDLTNDDCFLGKKNDDRNGSLEFNTLFNFTCTLCSRSFAKKKQLSKHVKRIHKDQIQDDLGLKKTIVNTRFKKINTIVDGSTKNVVNTRFKKINNLVINESTKNVYTRLKKINIVKESVQNRPENITRSCDSNTILVGESIGNSTVNTYNNPSNNSTVDSGRVQICENVSNKNGNEFIKISDKEESIVPVDVKMCETQTEENCQISDDLNMDVQIIEVPIETVDLTINETSSRPGTNDDFKNSRDKSRKFYYTCELCIITFDTRATILKHFKDKHRNIIEETSLIQNNSTSDLENVMSISKHLNPDSKIYLSKQKLLAKATIISKRMSNNVRTPRDDKSKDESITNTTVVTSNNVTNNSLVNVSKVVEINKNVPNIKLIDVHNDEPIEVDNDELIEVPNDELVKVHNGELIKVHNELIEIPNDELIEIPNDELIEDPNEELIEVHNDELIEVPNDELIKVHNELIEVHNVEPIEVDNDELIEVPNDELVKVHNGELIKVYNGELIKVHNEVIEIPNDELIKVHNDELIEDPNEELIEVHNDELIEVPNDELIKVHNELIEVHNDELIEVPNDELIEVHNDGLIEVDNNELVDESIINRTVDIGKNLTDNSPVNIPKNIKIYENVPNDEDNDIINEENLEVTIIPIEDVIFDLCEKNQIQKNCNLTFNDSGLENRQIYDEVDANLLIIDELIETIDCTIEEETSTKQNCIKPINSNLSIIKEYNTISGQSDSTILSPIKIGNETLEKFEMEYKGNQNETKLFSTDQKENESSFNSTVNKLQIINNTSKNVSGDLLNQKVMKEENILKKIEENVIAESAKKTDSKKRKLEDGRDETSVKVKKARLDVQTSGKVATVSSTTTNNTLASNRTDETTLGPELTKRKLEDTSTDWANQIKKQCLDTVFTLPSSTRTLSVAKSLLNSANAHIATEVTNSVDNASATNTASPVNQPILPVLAPNATRTSTTGCFKYTPHTLVGRWGRRELPRFPKVSCYFWPFGKSD